MPHRLLPCWLAFAVTALAGAETLEIPDATIRSRRNVSVPALEPGVVRSIEVQEGDAVRAGDVLVKIDDVVLAEQKRTSELEAEVARLRSANDVDRRFARKSAEVARAEVRRLEEATEQYPRSVPESERAQLELQAERARLAMEQADRDLEEASVTLELRESQVKVLEQRLRQMIITAPTDGVVVERFVDVGEWAPQGAPLVRILSLDALRVEAYASADDADDGLLGRAAEFEIRIGKARGTIVPCRISFVSPEIHPVDRSVRLFAELQEVDDALRPGMRGLLRIPSPTR